MDIASLSAAAAAAKLINSRTSTQNGADSVSLAFQKAGQRVQQQRDAVSVQLSAFGQIKSSFSDAQVAARALGDTKQTATDADIKKAATNFVKAFNTAAQTAKSATAAQGALADNGRARLAGNDLRRTVSADATATSDLKKIGITQQKDGTLAIDTKKFDAALKASPDALRSTLSSIGQKVDQTATRELAKNGNIGNSVNSLDNRARSLESRQVDQQAQAAAVQQLVSAQTTRLNNSLNTGAAAYERIFSI
ncbi:MAG: flagellar filament capping protein FliD [Sulfuritalea sp.]|jgi:flagellar hook-associated protein 2|nr:flagellar filament capping protein FliD [Sulfuritalea sp.]